MHNYSVRYKHINKALIKKIFISIICIAVILVTAFLYLLDKNLTRSLSINEPQIITIKQGTSVAALARTLVDRGWLNNRFWLRAYARLKPQNAIIKTGTYQISPDSSLQTLLKLFTSGIEHQFKFTIIEGTTFKELLLQLKEQSNLTHHLSTMNIEQISKELGINQINPEGWFFPETYAFTKGTKDIELLKRAHDSMKKILNDLWENRSQNLPFETPYQALIMASIIEKETSHIPEQPLISSVFINRLAKKMRLQTDPTVIYGLGDRYKGDITRAHLREKTAYNTYKINGLPPTPIAMPGLTALQAALNPESSTFFYFVSQGNGKHVFSETLAQHNKAVKDYLAKQRLKK